MIRSLRQQLPGGFDFRRRIAGKLAPGAHIPIAGILEIAFQHMHDAVQPARLYRIVALHDFVRGFPFTLFEVFDSFPQGVREIHGSRFYLPLLECGIYELNEHIIRIVTRIHPRYRAPAGHVASG